MAIDLANKEFSPGQITKSTWDNTNNAVRVNLVAASGGATSGLSLESTQLDVLSAIQDLEPNASLSALGNPVYFDYSGTPVDNSAYVEIIADSGADIIRQVNIFDSSGQSLYLAFGAALSEVDQIIICPGGQGQLPMQIPAHTRVSIKAVDTTASAGILTISLFG